MALSVWVPWCYRHWHWQKAYNLPHFAFLGGSNYKLCAQLLYNKIKTHGMTGGITYIIRKFRRKVKIIKYHRFKNHFNWFISIKLLVILSIFSQFSYIILKKKTLLQWISITFVTTLYKSTRSNSKHQVKVKRIKNLS